MLQVSKMRIFLENSCFSIAFSTKVCYNIPILSKDAKTIGFMGQQGNLLKKLAFAENR